jgi:enamine deaminase RidA (YjgF/YER057c/UK114 family)
MSFGMPQEKEYGYAQVVKVGDTIYASGQVSHDDSLNSPLHVFLNYSFNRLTVENVS